MLFELWCWRRLLRVPWTARRSNQSILKETSPEYSLEGLMVKLPNSLANSCEEPMEKTLMLRQIEGRRTMGWQRVRWLECITNKMDMSLSKLWETAKDGEVWNATVHGITKSRPRLSDLTTNYWKSSSSESETWQQAKTGTIPSQQDTMSHCIQAIQTLDSLLSLGSTSVKCE